ncbi:mannitol operon transcriptional antiterminator [Planomicrobium stackebrandtii]|uniref:Mannitol operon transcriptional antiterminator n=1 Tax=Planomicrobium stackebrandtii TaxID=253160 RepID=A0ABU0GSW4_9BACL|nr:BglG family transcription antiterminator [Planomicrobium stackebrandtii]MDQ0428441.1 mannitol operon transcriptional antiterminator [Planomicrobium stackebrandtii]
MALDHRSRAILSHLSQAQGYVTANEIMETFNISRRTIYYDISKINGWLEANELPVVQHARTAGFQLDRQAARQIPEKLDTIKLWHYEYSAKERRAWLAVYLLARNRPLYLESLVEKIRVSRNTVIEDLKSLRDELSHYGLQLEFDRKLGYVIKGLEENKRQALVFYLQQLMPKQSWEALIEQLLTVFSDNADFLDVEKVEEVTKIVAASEEELGIQYTDDFLQSLSLRILVFVCRLSQGKQVRVDLVEQQVLAETPEYGAAIKISRKLADLFQVAYPQDEVFYMTKHILSSRIQFSQTIFESSNLQNDNMLSDIVSKMVIDFQRYACIIFDNREEVERNLLLHVKTAYYRVLYGLEVESGLEDPVKEKYPDIFRLTKKVSRHLEKATGKPVNDGELILITMHFGGWMEKMGVQPADRKNALLVCNTGVGTSRLLQNQLEGLLSTVDIIGCVSLRDYEENDQEADFVISTIPLVEKGKPVFVVSPILTDTEKERLLKNINSFVGTDAAAPSSLAAVMDIIRQHTVVKNESALKNDLKQYLQPGLIKAKETHKPDLKELLPIENIQCLSEVVDWQQAIHEAAQPLLNEEAITANYVKAMIDALNEMGPYVVISPKVAIPHARPQDGVKKLGMALLQLKKSVSFSGNVSKPVNLVIVLAAVDGDAHLKALHQLTKMLSNRNLKEKLITAESPNEIYRLLADQSS